MDASQMNGMSSQLGLINSMRTGNVVLDMVICMLIPLLFQAIGFIFSRYSDSFAKFMESLKTNQNVCLKVLEYEFRTNSWGGVVRAGKEERNNILQKAITLYIAEHVERLKLPKARISFMAVKEKSSRNDNYETVYGSTAEQLLQYSVCTLPSNDVWVDMEPGLQFMQSVVQPNDEGENKITKTTIRYLFKADEPGGAEHIDKYIQAAFDLYVQKMKATQDFSRYLYMLVKTPATSSSSGGDEEGSTEPAARLYKRYKLSDEKSFDCVFFPEKPMLLSLLKNFVNKTGRYAIKGFPHKLGLLLHGPPGTGKTSLIKCLAQHTGRHVVSIPLARIETNQELMDIVFDQTFAVKGEDIPLKHSFKDIIFVMEDVDAASPIVMSRKPNDGGSGGDKAIANGSSSSAPADEATGGASSDTVVVEVGGDGGDNKAAGPDSLMQAVISSMMDSGTDTKKAGTGDQKNIYASKYDRLDLAGLLNVLDGVVDCPNRILVMTTNHPEKLDAALIRPGRIDKIVYLGYIQPPEARQMVQHYFTDTMTEKQYARLEEALTGSSGAGKNSEDDSVNFTPAEVEQMCAEFESVDEFLTALEDKVDETRKARSLLSSAASNPKSASAGLVRQVTQSGGNDVSVSLRRCTSTAASKSGGTGVGALTGGGADALDDLMSSAAPLSAVVTLKRGLSATTAKHLQ